MSEPLFMYDKTYRTRAGTLVYRVRKVGDMWRGQRECDQNGMDYLWQRGGCVTPGVENPNDLMPGAIEDEEQTAVLNDEKAIFKVLESHQKQIDFMKVTIDMQRREMLDAMSDLHEMTKSKPPPKRIIKGGWVNVYDYGRGVLHISPVIFKTRDECKCEGGNQRIACIQIPDFEEGEGL